MKNSPFKSLLIPIVLTTLLSSCLAYIPKPLVLTFYLSADDVVEQSEIVKTANDDSSSQSISVLVSQANTQEVVNSDGKATVSYYTTFEPKQKLSKPASLIAYDFNTKYIFNGQYPTRIANRSGDFTQTLTASRRAPLLQAFYNMDDFKSQLVYLFNRYLKSTPACWEVYPRVENDECPTPSAAEISLWYYQQRYRFFVIIIIIIIIMFLFLKVKKII